MGMFDNITVDPNFLPQVEELTSRNLSHSSFQTKDLDCALFDFEIDENGILYREIVEMDLEREKPKFGTLPIFKVISSKKEKYPHTGNIEFYNNYYCDDGTIYVTFELTTIDGVVRNVATLKEVRLDKMEDILARRNKYETARKNFDNDPICQLGRMVIRFIHRITDPLNGLSMKITKYINSRHF